MFDLLRAYKQFDPAAQSLLEVALLYPGVKAQAFHRVAHWLYRMRVPVLPRLVSELSRWLTGIEIHPGARIGRNVIIEHGMGTVIGETAEVEDDVVILHGVTLGARHIRGANPGKRHPTVRKGATLCAGAQIVGAVTVGEGAMVGANSVVLADVPAGGVAVGVPARIARAGPRLRSRAA
jgi:serine O-acetyltransferase